MKSNRNRLKSHKSQNARNVNRVTSVGPHKTTFKGLSRLSSMNDYQHPVTSTSSSRYSTSQRSLRKSLPSSPQQPCISQRKSLQTTFQQNEMSSPSIPSSHHISKRLQSNMPKYIIIPGMDDETEEDIDPNACRRDPLGRPLPTDYYGHLHDPYDMFKDETSTVFDPLVYGVTEIPKIREIYKATIAALPAEHLKVRATITDPKELEAYDNIMTPILNPEYYLEYIAVDNGKPYSDTHFIYDRLNHPDPDKNYLPHRFGHQNWKDFLIGDFFNGTREMKIRLAITYFLMFGSCGMLVYDGVSGIIDYWESIEYPHHHHPSSTDH